MNIVKELDPVILMNNLLEYKSNLERLKKDTNVSDGAKEVIDLYLIPLNTILDDTLRVMEIPF